MARDSSGNIYIIGTVQSNDLTATAGALQTVYSGGACPELGPPIDAGRTFACGDAFVMKLDAAGNIVYVTYLGGSGDDQAAAIAVDAQGNAFVSGTTSPNVSGMNSFPITSGALYPTVCADAPCGFLAKINPGGTALLYSTFLPLIPNQSNEPNLAVDAQGEALVVGGLTPGASGFVTTPGAFEASSNADYTNAIIKLAADGSKAVYSTYFNEGAIYGVALDTSGNLYLTGSAASNFPATPGALDQFQTAASSSVFVAKLNATGTGLAYAALYGGSGQSQGNSIRVDSDGNAYVLGQTGSTDFPVTPGAFQASGPSSAWNPTPSGGLNSFLAELSPTGSALVYSTYLAGATALDVDGSGNAYVLGQAAAGFPVTPGAFQRCMNGGGGDAYAAQFSASGSVVGATYLGGSGTEQPLAIAAAANGSVVASGTTNSADFPGLIEPAPGQSLLFVDTLAINNPNTADGPCVALALQNGASFIEGPIAPLEIVTIRGSGIGPDAAAVEQAGPDGSLPTELAGVQVFFDGNPAQLLYVQSQQIDAIVPASTDIHILLGPPSTQLQVQYNGVPTNSVSVPMTSAAPGIFIVNAAASQPAILNQDGTLNSVTNPAKAGSVISIFGTGGDFVMSPGSDTSAYWPLSPLSQFTASVTLNGSSATVLYAGSAPSSILGMFQINAQLPESGPLGTAFLTVEIDGALSQSVPITIAQ